jgi:hypothetical protein
MKTVQLSFNDQNKGISFSFYAFICYTDAALGRHSSMLGPPLVKKVTDILKAIILYWGFIVDDALTSFMTESGDE